MLAVAEGMTFCLLHMFFVKVPSLGWHEQSLFLPCTELCEKDYLSTVPILCGVQQKFESVESVVGASNWSTWKAWTQRKAQLQLVRSCNTRF